MILSVRLRHVLRAFAKSYYTEKGLIRHDDVKPNIWRDIFVPDYVRTTLARSLARVVLT